MNEQARDSAIEQAFIQFLPVRVSYEGGVQRIMDSRDQTFLGLPNHLAPYADLIVERLNGAASVSRKEALDAMVSKVLAVFNTTEQYHGTTFCDFVLSVAEMGKTNE